MMNMPEVPIAGSKVAFELEKVCTQNTCSHLNDWLNRLYTFKIQYEAYIKARTK